jgi:SAM-dependent methyltransferase
MTDLRDWAGQTGDVWAQEHRRTDRSFVALAPHLDALILAVAPARPFSALDIGCGAGATACALAAARPDADVVGIDLSEPLVAVARARPPLANLRFAAGDVTARAAEFAPVDLYVSRHGVMFFADPVAAFATLARAAAPVARLVFSCFAERRANRFAADLLAAIGQDGEAPAGDAPGPFAFADPVRVGSVLSSAGWSAEATRVDFAYRAGEGEDPVGDAVSFFSRIGPVAPVLRDAPDAARRAMQGAIAAVCVRRLRDGAVDFPAAAWLWSATLSEHAL